MVDIGHPRYCGRCGSPTEAGDQFCGSCGSAVLPPAPQAEQVIPRPVAAARGSAARSGSRPLLLVGVLGALAVLLVGGGVLALVGLGAGSSLLGGSEQDPPPPSEERGVAPAKPETTEDTDPAQEPTDQPEGSGATEPTSAPPLLVTSTPEPTTSTGSSANPANLEAEAEEAAGDYYRAAGSGDWGYTYDHLDSETQSHFTREEWFQKNQWFADNGSVIYHIESVERLGTSSGIVVGVTLRLTYEDGSSSTRNTYFVYEDGGWKHAFGEEEYDLFMPDLSYEEFVQAQ